MSIINYRDAGLTFYGNRCEICGFGLVEVHHIDYGLHDTWERILREADKKGQDLAPLLEEAKKYGFLEWDGHDLSKDNRTTNLSVLCPNHHTMVHTANMGKSLLKLIPKRR